MLELQSPCLALAVDWVAERVLWVEQAYHVTSYATADTHKTFTINSYDINFGGHEIVEIFISSGTVTDMMVAPLNK